VALTEKSTSVEEVNGALKKAADGPLQGILEFCTDDLVSIDFRANPHSSIVDAGFTKVIDGNLVKLTAWYDNEWGYSCRVRDLINFMAKKF
jgi:glyceraldehyde 3-phosphate dehydrogenase